MSKIILRDYQVDLVGGIFHAWNQGTKNVLGVCATGSGKTVMKSEVIHSFGLPSVAIAHRQELVSQVSLALAACGIYHNIIAPAATIKIIVGRHMKKFGRNYHDSNSNVSVAGIDTLIRRKDDKKWKQIRLWSIDEGHHLLRSNKWGQGVEMFPNAQGCGWTATPIRADRKSLAYEYDGYYQTLVNGPSMHSLIERGYLSRYKIIGPPPSINTRDIKIGSSGEFVGKQLSAASAASTIIGDVVKHYLKFAAGKRGITFAVSVRDAIEIADAYRAAGVPCEVLTDKTPTAVRGEIMDRLESGDILNVVNVDMLGEGTDVPAVEVVSMARPTASYGLFVQQFGRGIRTSPGKQFGIIIDHVQNCERHGLPDAPIDWTLTEPDIRNLKQRDLPLRQCVNPECFLAWEGYSLKCPHCGHRPPPEPSSEPDKVEGDLNEYTPELLEQLRQKAAQAIRTFNGPVRSGTEYKQREYMEARAAAQGALRDTIALWAGWRRDYFLESDEVRYRRFHRTFGVDVLSAQSLPGPDALKLKDRIVETMNKDIRL